jgi:hypothetical protein
MTHDYRLDDKTWPALCGEAVTDWMEVWYSTGNMLDDPCPMCLVLTALELDA